MRRPLAFICLMYIVVAGVLIWLRPPDFNNFEYAEGVECSVVGELYKIESRQFFGQEQTVFYLNQISHFEVIQENPLEQSNYRKNDYRQGNSKQKDVKPKGVICYVSDDTGDIELGSKVLVTGIFENFKRATNPGEFDARIYNYTLGIYGKIMKASVAGVTEDYNAVAEGAYRIRTGLEAKLKSIYPDKEAGILMTMLLGNKSELDGDIKGLYQIGGIIHILSVSGLHISVLGHGMYNLLRKAGIPVRVAAVMAVLWMWFYGEMIGMGVSAFRAVVMFSVRMAAVCCGRTYDLITALAVAAAILIGTEPLYFYHSGFWLSFSCVLAISLLYPLMKIEEKEEYNLWQRWLVKVGNSFMVSVGITVFTLPVMLWFYYEVSLWGLLWNLIVVPLASVVMGGGVVTLAMPINSYSGSRFYMGISDTVARLIAKGNCAVLRFFEQLCRITEWSGVGNFVMGKPEIWQVCVFGAGMVILISMGKKLKYYQRIGMIVGLIIILTFKTPQGFRITFLDVGQGDGICIQNDNGNVYFVDGGSSSKSNVGTYQILPFLKHEGIGRIDAVLLSHGDKDHISGIEELIGMQKGGVKIDKVILPDLDRAVLKQEFAGIVELCRENGTDIYIIPQGESICDGELMLTCMHPVKGYKGDSNETSMVLHLNYKNFSTLLTGDVESSGEKVLNETMAEQGIDAVTLLKVAHHGSSGSTGVDFLNQISPQVAVISCGKNNFYGHPHKETIERLEDVGADILTTTECGAIILEIDDAVSIRTVKRN